MVWPGRSSSRLLASLSLLVTLSWVAGNGEINYRGIIAKQTTDRFGVTLREVLEGDRLTEALVTAGGEVVACEEGPASNLLSPPQQPPPASNLTLVTSREDLPSEFAWLASYRADCRRVENYQNREKRSTSKRKTRHGRNKMNKMRKKAKRKNRNHLAKGKTGSWKESLMTPGTKWCGPGNTARRYSDLGPSPEADRCCRDHDRCRRYILGLSRGHGHTNLNPFTLSHCSCDRRFRTCLKMAGTTASTFVGKLFFNFVQTNCFVLKTERICTKRNRKGKCLKMELTKLAHVRSNMSF